MQQFLFSKFVVIFQINSGQCLLGFVEVCVWKVRYIREVFQNVQVHRKSASHIFQAELDKRR